jgi:predicted acyl esterase
LTDPLFPALEPLQMRNLLKAADPGYPIKLFLADIGHDYTGERQDEWDYAHERMNAFVDHYLRPDRTPAPPVFDVGSTITRCLDHDAPMRVVTAPTWDGLHTAHATFESAASGATPSAPPGPAALATDPISTATLPLPGSYKGCRVMRPAERDPLSATYEFAAETDLVMVGGPVVDVTFTTTAPDTELNVRLWDVAPDGSAQGLVTRGTYRSLDPPGSGRRARFQIAPQGYRFPAGHKIKVEVAANDAPYYQQSNIPAVVQVERLTLTLPLYQPEAAPAASMAGAAAPTPAPRVGGTAGVLPATGAGHHGGLALGILALGYSLRRRHRRLRTAPPPVGGA